MELFLNNYKSPAGILPIKEDEFLKEGMPYCSKCKTPRFCKTEIEGEKYITRIMCECQREEKVKEEKLRIIEERERQFREQQKISKIGDKYLNARLATARKTKSNEKAYQSAINYVNNAREILKNGIGLYIYGDNSSGKTYLTACICNELVRAGYTCVFTSIPKLLAETQRRARENGMSQAEIVDTLSRKQFLFIDDLGKEFLGDASGWERARAEKLLLEVLNARYGNGLPTLFTSNYSLEDFATKFGLDKAILERVNEMSTIVIKLEGDNFRDQALKEKEKIAKGLGL